MKLLTEQYKIIITENYKHGSFINMYFSNNKIEKQSPKNNNFKLNYKSKSTLIFNIAGRDKTKGVTREYIRKTRNKFEREILNSKKLKQILSNEFFKSSIYSGNLHNIWGSHALIKILPKMKINNLDYSKRGDFFFADFEYHLQFNLIDWLWLSLKNGKTTKSLFFKKYTISYKYNLPPIIRYKTINWKKILTKSFIFAIKNHIKIKSFFKDITKINPNNTRLEIKFFPTDKSFKINSFGWLTKLLLKFGLSKKYAKLLSTGISLFSYYKIFKYISDEEEKEKTKKIFKKIKHFILH